MKNKLLITYLPNIEYYTTTVPTSIGHITSFIKDEGYSVEQENLDSKLRLKRQKSCKEVVDFTLFKDGPRLKMHLQSNDSQIKEETEKILKLSKFTEFDVVGISVLSEGQIGTSLCFAKLVKEKNPDVNIVLGGPVLFHDDIEISKFSFIDFVVRGEGELAMKGIMDYLEDKIKLQEIPSVTYDGNRNKIDFPKIDDIPAPTLKNIYEDYFKVYEEMQSKEEEDKPIIPYQISRGCKNRCFFCEHRNHEVIELKDPHKIVNDLKKIADEIHGEYYIYFGCNSVNLSRQHVEKICDLLIEKNVNIKWVSFGFSDEDFDIDLVEKMKKSGCVSLSFGLESGSQNLLDKMNKNMKIEHIENSLRYCFKAGIITDISILIGTPWEKKEHIIETIRFIERNKKNINIAYVCIFNLYPGSSLFKKMYQEKAISEDRKGVLKKYSSDNLPENDKLRRLKRVIETVLERSGIEIYRFGFAEDGFDIDDPIKEVEKIMLFEEGIKDA